MDALAARALIARTPGLTADPLASLLARAGGDLTEVPRSARNADAGLPPAARSFLIAPDERSLARDRAWLEDCGAAIVLATDREYPPLLRQSPSPPAALYVLGSVSLLSSPQLAMVGSRSPTPSGCATAREFAAWFARSGITVTSGLALGIDAASHEGALSADGASIAVFGTGLDRVYPPEHRELAARLRESGALVSEFPPGTPPRRENFPLRNRIIAGLTLGTLVVEAARVSGSLITARLAGEAGREVFAIPGSIHSPLSRGCHQLIKHGAKLVDEANDVLTELKFSLSKEVLTKGQAEPGQGGASLAPLDKEYEMLLDALGFEPATIDSLVARTELPNESIASMLLILELEGRVAALPGGRFGRIP